MGNDLVFYNSYGDPIAYCEDGEHIYLYNGEPVAYFHNDSVYSFDGDHLGWFEQGWVRDNNGDCVFYSDNAQGGPVKPIKSIRPIKSVKSIKPIKSVKSIKPIKAIKSLSWSQLSSDIFFRQ